VKHNPCNRASIKLGWVLIPLLSPWYSRYPGPPPEPLPGPPPEPLPGPHSASSGPHSASSGPHSAPSGPLGVPCRLGRPCPIAGSKDQKGGSPSQECRSCGSLGSVSSSFTGQHTGSPGTPAGRDRIARRANALSQNGYGNNF